MRSKKPRNKHMTKCNMSSRILKLLAPLNEVLIWCSNYFVSQTHALPTGLKRGQWHDTDTQLLHGCMTALVNYIEVEQAWMHAICEDGLYKTLPWWARFSVTRAFTIWRNPTFGLARLEWERKLVHSVEEYAKPEDVGQLTSQAKGAQAQLELYLWWKARGSRIELFLLDEKDPMTRDRQLKALVLLEHPEIKEIYPNEPGWALLERAYKEEDTAALHKLIDIRGHLWT